MNDVANTIIGFIAIIIVCVGFAAIKNGALSTGQAETTLESVTSDTPSAEQESTPQTTPMTVSYVKDGDTFVAKDETGEELTIRLIGVDTPESVASDEYLEKTGKQNTEEGKTASEFTKSILQDKTVYIELDVQECDKYGRVLAYVWLDEETMLQDVLIQNGYAELMTIPPNVKYADRFTAIKTDLHSEQSD